MSTAKGNDGLKLRKIAFILTPIEFGGAERVSLSFLQQYKRQGTQIFPILLCRPWETENHFIKMLGKTGLEYSLVPTRTRPRQQGGDYFRVLRCACSIFSLLKKGRFDLVHTNGYFADIIGLVAAKMLGIPIVTTCHGFISNTLKFRFYNSLNIIALRFMDRVITVSENMKNDLIDQGIAAKKITIIQNAVESAHDSDWLKTQRRTIREQYGIGDNECVLGYVGRLSMEKGLRFLLEAGATLLEKKIPVRIIVVGDGPQRDEMQELVHNLGLTDAVIFVGFQKDVVSLLPAFTAFVLPSLTEGTSMALLEAMACGLPVIATAVGGTPDVVTSRLNGLLVPAASPQAIVEAVEELFDNRQLGERLGAAATQTIDARFSITGWLEKVESLYTDVLAEKA